MARRTWNLPCIRGVIALIPIRNWIRIALCPSAIAVSFVVVCARILITLLGSRTIAAGGNRLSVLVACAAVSVIAFIVAIVVPAGRTGNSPPGTPIVTLADLRVGAIVLSLVVVGAVSDGIRILIVLPGCRVICRT